MNHKKKPSRCRCHALDPCLDSSIPRFSNSFGSSAKNVTIIYAESIASVYPEGEGGRHSLKCGGVGGANLDDWRGSLVLCLFCLCLHI